MNFIIMDWGNVMCMWPMLQLQPISQNNDNDDDDNNNNNNI